MKKSLKILFIHQNFPGQFRSLAPAMVAAGHQVRALSMRPNPGLQGVSHVRYAPARSSTVGIHPWLVNTEAAVIRAEAVAQNVDGLMRRGWCPDVVLGHTGWGEMMLMRQVLPNARLIGFNELYYRDSGGDVGFDPEFPSDLDTPRRLQVRNLHLLSSLLNCDAAITPTYWQASCFPLWLQNRLSVIHDGIQTDRLTPNPNATFALPKRNLCWRVNDELITFINRNLEPMRGYHQFMRALPQILRERPRAQVVIVGGDHVSYGVRPSGELSYKQIFLQEVQHELDMGRVHFVNRLPYGDLMTLLSVSAVHVYLTVPFVLSWSMLEAMSLGAVVVGSDTAPVREVIEDDLNGKLVDFFDPQQLAATVCKVLDKPAKYIPMREAARRTIVERYDFRTRTLPRYLELIEGAP